MSQPRIVTDHRPFGLYLRRIRENRQLSLDAVEEMTVGYPEPVTKSHLSRIENGRAVPTFPRMFALSQVYGVPISSMAERFETDLRRDGSTDSVLDPEQPQGFLDRVKEFRQKGRYDLILKWTTAALDALQPGEREDRIELQRRISIWQVGAMIKLEHYESCKVRCEQLLGWIPSSSEYHLRALLSFVICSYRLRRFEVALMGRDWVERKLLDGEWPADLIAIAHSTSASVHHAVGDYAKAKEGFQRALALFDELNDGLERCRARINLGQALTDLGQHRTAIRYLTAGVDEATGGRWDRLAAIGLSHLAVVHFKDDRLAAAERYAIQSNAYARGLDLKPTLFRNCYYLWKLAGLRHDEAGVAANEKSLRALKHRVPRDMHEVEAFLHANERGDQ